MGLGAVVAERRGVVLDTEKVKRASLPLPHFDDNVPDLNCHMRYPEQMISVGVSGSLTGVDTLVVSRNACKVLPCGAPCT